MNTLMRYGILGIFLFLFIHPSHSSDLNRSLEDPKSLLSVEYRLIEVPSLSVSSSMMLARSFHSSQNFPKDARVLKSWAFEVNDNSFTSIEPETVLVEDQDPRGVSVFSQTTLRSIRGSDRIRVKSDVSIKNLGAKDRQKKIVSEVDLLNNETTALSSWSELKRSKVVGYVLLVKVEKTRTPNAATFDAIDP